MVVVLGRRWGAGSAAAMAAAALQRPIPSTHITLSAVVTAMQIARIAATTVLCPTGLFVVNEDGGLDKAEEWAPLPDREMGAAANWVHRCG